MNQNKFTIIILLVFVVFSAIGQNINQLQLKGKVLNENAEPLPGATVVVKNSSKGTVTDLNGEFSLKTFKGSTIVISYVGYAKTEFLVDKENDQIIITLQPISKLDEVVVTGLGVKQRKVSAVGAITYVKPEELQVPATSMSNILGGRVAGVINMQSSGEPGKNISEFWVRGIGTFGASNSALVLIDGLEGDLNSIDPADVESFSVLKDAAATAVYGVRGANGVVLVTTKRGKEGKLQLTARANATLSTLTKMPDYVGAYDYARLMNEALVVRGSSPKYTQRDMDIIKYNLDPDLYPSVDWQNEIMNNASLQNTYYLSAQGGGTIARYFASMSMSNENAAYKMDPESKYNSGVGYNTYGFRTNLDIDLTPTTTMYFGTEGYLTYLKSPGIASTDYIWQAQSQLTPLLVPTRYSTGQLPAYGPDNNYSPYVMINYTGNSSKQTYTGQVTLALNQDLKFILNGLKLKVQGAYDNKSYFDERRYVLPEMYWATGRSVDGQLQLTKRVSSVTAQYTNYQRQYRKYHFESTLNYEKIFNKINRFSALLYYYMSDSKDTYDIGTASGVNTSMSAIPKRYQGLSGRITYSYNDTYMLDTNFGYTGSENFQPGRQFGFFPSVAAGWRPSQYEWVQKNLKWIDNLKIRGSYGSVGSDRISSRRFPYLTILNENASVAWANGVQGITESSIGADNLMWEKSIKSDIGIDATLFRSKFDLTIDFFNDQRDGIFQQRQSIPAYVGLLAMPYGNVGKMRSYGSDGNVSFNQKINKDWSFTVRGNFTYSRNEIQNWEQAPQKYLYQAYNGYTNGAMRGYIALGLFRDAQDVLSSPVQQFGSKVLPGDIKYKDVNGDGVINPDDKVALSDPTYPRLMYGFGGELKYKNLTLGVLFKGTGSTPFYYVGQSVDGVNNGMGYVPFYGGATGNVLTIVASQKNRWTPASYSGNPSTENPNARFPRLDYGYNANNSQLSTFWKDDGWYLRLQEVSINYNLKETFLKTIGVSSIDLQLVGSNLFVWDDVKLWDPEQAYKNGQAYPIPARYSFQAYFHF